MMNKLLPIIPRGDIMELKELIYAGAKLVNDKIRVPRRNLNGNARPGWEIRLEGQVKKLQQEARILRKEKHVRICWNEKTKIRQQKRLAMQLEEVNQKILAKEVRLKRY